MPGIADKFTLSAQKQTAMAGHDEKKNKKVGSNPGLFLFRHCERSEAIHSGAGSLDCFVACAPRNDG
jgi:hypothetical protein